MKRVERQHENFAVPEGEHQLEHEGEHGQQEQVGKAVDEFIAAGLPAAEQIAAEFEAEVDPDTAARLADLEKQAKKARYTYLGAFGNRISAQVLKQFERHMPESRKTESMAYRLEQQARQNVDKKIDKLIYPFRGSDPHAVIDEVTLRKVLKLAERHDQSLPDVRRLTDSFLDQTIEKYLRKALKDQGPAGALESYKRLAPGLRATGFATKWEIGSFAYHMYSDMVEQSGSSISDQDKQALIAQFEDYPELLAAADIYENPYVEKNYEVLDSEQRVAVIKDLYEREGPVAVLASYDRGKHLTDEDFAKVKQLLFESHIKNYPKDALKHLDEYGDLFNALSEPEQLKIWKGAFSGSISEVDPRDLAKSLKYVQNVPEQIRHKVFEAICRRTSALENVLLDKDAWEKLGVSAEEAVTKYVTGNGWEFGSLIADIDKSVLSESEKVQLVTAVLESKNALKLYGSLDVVKQYLTPEQLSKLIDEAINVLPDQVLHKVGDLSLSPAQVDQLIDKLFKHHKAGPLTENKLRSVLHLSPEQEWSVLIRLTRTQFEQMSYVMGVEGGYPNLTPNENQELLLLIARQAPYDFSERWDRITRGLNEAQCRELAQAYYERAVIDNNKAKIERLKQASGLEVEYTPDMQGAITGYLKKQKPSEFVAAKAVVASLLPPETKIESIPWEEIYGRLEKLQARSANQGHDVWSQELDPLVANAAQEGLVDTNKEVDGAIVYDFVHAYGMYNLPVLFKWHTAITRAKNVEDLPIEIREELTKNLGLNLEKLPNKGFITKEIKQYRNRIQSELLADRIPDSLESSKLAKEVFSSLIGSTQWGRSDTLEDLLKLWRQVESEKPELSKLPEGYEEISLEVPVVSRNVDKDWLVEKAKREKSIVENPEVQAVVSRIMEAHDAIHGPLSAWWSNQRLPEILNEIDGEILTLQQKAENLTSDKARFGIEKQITELQKSYDSVKVLKAPDMSIDKDRTEPEKANEDQVLFMEQIVKVLPKKLKSRQSILRALSVAHQVDIMPQGQFDLIEKATGEEGKLISGSEKIKVLAQSLVDYTNEHYLHPQQSPDHTGHPGFSSALLDELRIVWGVKQNLKENILVKSANKLRELEQSGDTVSEKTIPISLVPAKGLLRIYGGDVGNACYTSKHQELAKGEFPGITAFTYVTNRGTQNERLRGSVLIVETETEEGEPEIVVRANNPQENLLSQVDVDALMSKVLEEFKLLAKRRNIQKVGVPLDQASMSCSNRPGVAGYYRREFSKAPKVGLKNQPETNFNGYANWNKDGNSAVVEI